jgi:magnesium transporter
LGAPATIAAIYGMNFPLIPGLHAQYGFAIVIAVMASLCVGLYVRFRKLRWL